MTFNEMQAAADLDERFSVRISAHKGTLARSFKLTTVREKPHERDRALFVSNASRPRHSSSSDWRDVTSMVTLFGL
jgi:hypothetical protein